MSSDSGPSKSERQRHQRHQRLAAALRENLKRRKAQERGRAQGAAPRTGQPAGRDDDPGEKT